MISNCMFVVFFYFKALKKFFILFIKLENSFLKVYYSDLNLFKCFFKNNAPNLIDEISLPITQKQSLFKKILYAYEEGLTK